MGEAQRKHMKGLPFFGGMTSYLTMVEDQRKRIGQHPNHDQQHKSIALVDGRMFQMAIDSDGLKYFHINAPAATAELMNEQRRY